MNEFAILRVGDVVDVVAADASELVLLASTTRASMAHGALAPGTTSTAIVHRSVDELWFVVSGSAEIWRAIDQAETVDVVAAGASLSLPCGVRFQYRTIGTEPFRFVMATIPAWPGDDEAAPTAGKWPEPS